MKNVFYQQNLKKKFVNKLSLRLCKTETYNDYCVNISCE